MKIEVIWCAEGAEDAYPEIILSDGSVLTNDGEGWGTSDDPVGRELARRLLEEHRQQEALDEHNDELEEAEASERAAWSVLNEYQDRLDGIAVNLQNIHSRLNAQARGADESRVDRDGIRSRLAKLEQEACFKGSEHEPLEEKVWRKIEMTKAGFQVCLDSLHDRLVRVENLLLQAEDADEREAQERGGNWRGFSHRLSMLEGAYGQLGKIELRHADLEERIEHLVKDASENLNGHDRRLAALEGRLATVQGLVRLDGETLNLHLGKIEKLEQDLRLVRGQAAHVDEREAGDFEATRIHLDGLDERVAALEGQPRTAVDPASPSGDQSRVNLDYNEWKRLVTLDELWGPEGWMRGKLAHFLAPGVEDPSWFRQLRSELLAMPEECLFEAPHPMERLPVEGEIRPVSTPSASRPGTPSGEGL